MNESRFKRILWAVDALQDCAEVEERYLEAMRVLVGDSDTEVEPVYTLPPQHISSAFELMYPPFEYYGKAVKESLGRLTGITSPKLRPLKIIDKLVMSTSGSVKALSDYAQETSTDLIVVGTHCRKGLPRLFLGSFAESLLLHSRVPLLMVGTHTRMASEIKSILFPTDFGKTSELVFSKVVGLAKSFGARLFIYHMAPKPIILPTGLVPPVDLTKLMENERNNADKGLQQYLAQAKQAGVDAESIFELSEHSESEAILSAAEDRIVDLIAMTAQSGAIRSAVAGSTTRQVVRSATRPVWVLHAHGAQSDEQFTITEEEVMSDLTEHGRERKRAS